MVCHNVPSYTCFLTPSYDLMPQNSNYNLQNKLNLECCSSPARIVNHPFLPLLKSFTEFPLRSLDSH